MKRLLSLSVLCAYSSKIIQAHEIGKWHVEILDDAGNLLEDVEFEVTP